MIRPHEGKTRIWNVAGEEPPAVADLGGFSHEPVCVGDWSLPPESQGFTVLVLGSPLGHGAFVAIIPKASALNTTAYCSRAFRMAAPVLRRPPSLATCLYCPRMCLATLLELPCP